MNVPYFPETPFPFNKCSVYLLSQPSNRCTSKSKDKIGSTIFNLESVDSYLFNIAELCSTCSADS